jgi:uncharacterized hydrophobic protein (TIGR00271 family)
MTKNPLRTILQVFKYRLNLDDDKASEDEVIVRISKSIEFKGTNLWTLVFAIFIASIGLNVNSTAVIIGAMLISPLMGPIMGLGMGAGIYDFKLINKAAKNLLIATLIGLSASTIYFLISPLNYAQSELLARTSPTIWDVLIAFFGGLAGIVAASRRNFNNIIPGVAIATALMPPLCTAGFGIASGQWYYFFGAIYLYLINSVFISISTFLIVRFLKYKPVAYVNPETATRVKRWVITIAILTIIPSLYLAYNFVKHEIFTQNANSLINKEAVTYYTIINKQIVPEKKLILLTVIDDVKTDSVSNLLELKKGKYDLEEATIIVKNSFTKNTIAPDINQLKEGLIQEMFTRQEDQLKLKNEELAYLKKQISEQNSFIAQRDEAVKEFYALYGKPQELAIEKVINHTLNSTDTTLMVYFKTASNKFGKDELKKIELWLSVKFNMKSIKVVKD